MTGNRNPFSRRVFAPEFCQAIPRNHERRFAILDHAEGGGAPKGAKSLVRAAPANVATCRCLGRGSAPRTIRLYESSAAGRARLPALCRGFAFWRDCRHPASNSGPRFLGRRLSAALATVPILQCSELLAGRSLMPGRAVSGLPGSGVQIRARGPHPAPLSKVPSRRRPSMSETRICSAISD